ncbi:hypothetical protein D3C81_1298600 [compost metagenome]
MQQILQVQALGRRGCAGFEHLRRVQGFGRHPGDMKQRRGRGGGKGGAERLEIVQAGLRLFQPVHQRNPRTGQGADVVAEQGVEAVVEAVQRRHFNNQLGLAPAVEVAADARCPPGQGDADVEVVRVLERARTQHTVGVDHRVGFGPDHLFAQGRRAVEQVRRAGKAQLRAHGHIGIAQGTGRLAERRVDAQFAPAALVDRNGIERGRHPHFRAPLHQLFGKAQAGGAGVDAAVDMRLGHVQQLLGALQLGHAQDDLHRHLRRFAMAAIK